MALNEPAVPSATPATAKVPARRNESPLWVVPLYLGGLLLVFVGQRILIELDRVRWAISGLGIGALMFATLVRFKPGDAQSERQRIERLLGVLSALGLLAIVLHFASTDWGLDRLGLAEAARETRERVQGILQVVWVALAAASIVPMLFAEVALHPMRRGPQLEARRVAAAAASGATLALAAAYGSLFVYAASETEVAADFSYFKTSEPGEATIKMVQSLDAPLQVAAFFPEVSEVRREIAGYFAKLGKHADKLQFSVHDRYLEPNLTRELQVSADGTIVLRKGEAKRTIVLGTDLKTVQPKLKTWDRDFQELLYKVIRSHRTAYLTVGHGELNDDKKGVSRQQGRTSNMFKQLLQKQNYVVRHLGLTDGLGSKIPADAALVAILGPLEPFAAEEIAALERYVDAGGSVFMALDADSYDSNEATRAAAPAATQTQIAPAVAAGGAGSLPAASDTAAPESPMVTSIKQLTSLAGLSFNPAILANETRHMQRAGNPSDNVILMTNRFSSHASVSTLSRNAGQATVVVLGASALDKAADAKTERVDFTLRSLSGTFPDHNRNFKQEKPAEADLIFNLGAAVAKAVETPAAEEKEPADAKDGEKKPEPPKEMRAFVLADADIVSDLLLSNFPANQMLAFDALRWLGGEESYTGAVNTEEDVRIEHTKQKDLVWFYGTIIGVPGLVLGGGLWLGRRARRRGETKRA